MRLVLKNPRGFLSTSHLSDDTSQAPPGLLPRGQKCLEKLGQERGADVRVENDEEDGKEREILTA